MFLFFCFLFSSVLQKLFFSFFSFFTLFSFLYLFSFLFNQFFPIFLLPFFYFFIWIFPLIYFLFYFFLFFLIIFLFSLLFFFISFIFYIFLFHFIIFSVRFHSSSLSLVWTLVGRSSVSCLCGVLTLVFSAGSVQVVSLEGELKTNRHSPQETIFSHDVESIGEKNHQSADKYWSQLNN